VTVLWHHVLLAVTWTGTQRNRPRENDSQFCSSDTYDVYYNNRALLPPLKARAADYPPGEVWTLDEGRGDATIEDICDFIVEYINSDVMVRFWVSAHALIQPIPFLHLTGLVGGPAHHHCRSIKGAVTTHPE
jgi:hypothetical protein